jgi:hypothetical protein
LIFFIPLLHERFHVLIVRGNNFNDSAHLGIIWKELKV